MTERLVILRPGQCAGCRELIEMRRLADQRALEIRRLEREIEALKAQAHAAGSPGAERSTDRRVRRRLFETPSIGELPLATRERT